MFELLAGLTLAYLAATNRTDLYISLMMVILYSGILMTIHHVWNVITHDTSKMNNELSDLNGQIKKSSADLISMSRDIRPNACSFSKACKTNGNKCDPFGPNCLLRATRSTSNVNA